MSRGKMSDKRLLIVDGLNMFLRSYIINPTMDPKGEAIGAIGFLKSLQKCARSYNRRDYNRLGRPWRLPKEENHEQELQEGRKPVRFNRRMIQLDPEQEIKNKAYQQLRTMKYLNELPVMQVIIDYVEADDIISYVVQHSKYKDYDKLIVSSDKDFSTGKREDRNLQTNSKEGHHFDVLREEYNIHPTTALARAIAGDPSDNLKGVPRVGLILLAKT